MKRKKADVEKASVSTLVSSKRWARCNKLPNAAREEINDEFVKLYSTGRARSRRPRAHHSRSLLFWVTFSLWLFGKSLSLQAQIGSTADPICRLPVFYDSIQSTNGRPEYDVKAAILYRCLELVRWPAQSLGSQSDPLRIGILGENQFGPSLKFLKGKKVAGRKLVVTELSGLSQARKCQLVFISCSETNRTAGILNELARTPVLTVGEVPGFTEQGGMINLLVVDNPATAPLAASSPTGGGTGARTKTIRFEVNATAAERAGVTLHPTLIKLGTHAQEPSPLPVAQPPVTQK